MGLVASAPELSVGGERARRTGLVVSATELSVGVKGACRTGLFVLAQELSIGGLGWLRLWGVAGSPSVDCSPKGDAPSSPELTVGADGDAVDWNAPRSVTYSRRGGI